MLYKKNGVTEEGISYENIEELTIYKLENKEQHQIIVEKLNQQIGFKYFQVEDVKYPFVFEIDKLEMFELTEQFQKEKSGLDKKIEQASKKTSDKNGKNSKNKKGIQKDRK